jgi:hypothetical protein
MVIQEKLDYVRIYCGYFLNYTYLGLIVTIKFVHKSDELFYSQKKKKMNKNLVIERVYILRNERKIMVYI